MNRRLVVPVGVSIFAVTLAIVIGSRLTGEALLVALGIALGVMLGIPAGVMAVLIGRRGEQAGSTPGIDEGSTAIVLTDQQAERLFRALERPQQASADAFTLPPRQERQFSAVGGADLGDTVDDTF